MVNQVDLSLDQFFLMLRRELLHAGVKVRILIQCVSFDAKLISRFIAEQARQLLHHSDRAITSKLHFRIVPLRATHITSVVALRCGKPSNSGEYDKPLMISRWWYSPLFKRRNAAQGKDDALSLISGARMLVLNTCVIGFFEVRFPVGQH